MVEKKKLENYSRLTEVKSREKSYGTLEGY